MNDKDKKIEKIKEFFNFFTTPKGKKIKTKTYTDEQILKIYQKIKENFPDEYKKAMQKVKTTNTNSYEMPTSKDKQKYTFYNKSSLYDAYKFFSYFDLNYKEGYDVSALTDDEVMEMYLDIKMNYPTKYNSVMENMRKTINPRQIAIPSHSILSNNTVVNNISKTSNENEDNDNKELDDLEEQRKQAARDKEQAINSLYQNDNEIDQDDVDLSKFGLSDDENEKDEEPVKVTNKRNIVKDKLKKLVDKLKNDRKFRRKVIITAAAAVIGIAAIGIGAAYTALTGDASAMGNLTEGVSEAVNTFGQNADPNVLTAANNFDISSMNLNDINFDLNNMSEIYSNAGDAANLTGGLTPDPSAGDVYMADLFNNVTGEYMNIDPNTLDLDDLNTLINNGDYSVAYTNNVDLIGQGGDKLANAGQITGFGNIDNYVDMAKETIKSSKGL